MYLCMHVYLSLSPFTYLSFSFSLPHLLIPSLFLSPSLNFPPTLSLLPFLFLLHLSLVPSYSYKHPLPLSLFLSAQPTKASLSFTPRVFFYSLFLNVRSLGEVRRPNERTYNFSCPDYKRLSIFSHFQPRPAP